MVGIADTGLDWNSCFFKDDRVTPTFEWSEARMAEARRDLRKDPEVWESTEHRKVVSVTVLLSS